MDRLTNWLASLPPNSAKRILITYFLPVVYLIAVLTVDASIPSGPITPLFLQIGVFLLAFYQSPRGMVGFSALFFSVIALIFFNKDFAHWVNNTAFQSPDRLTPFLRTTGFVITSSAACVLNRMLYHMRLANSDLDEILNVLPGAILTSDENGTIFYANRHARNLLGIGEDDALHKNYFELLTPQNSDGVTIKNYMQCFHTGSIGKKIPLEIGQSTPVTAHTKLLRSKKPPLLMTMIPLSGETSN